MYTIPYRITPKQAAQKVLLYFKTKYQKLETLPEEELYTACRDVFHLPVNLDIHSNYQPLDGSKTKYPSIYEILIELKNLAPSITPSYSF